MLAVRQASTKTEGSIMLGASGRVNRVLLALAGGSLLALGCGDNGGGGSADSLSRLMDDGDVAAVVPTAAGARPPPMTAPPRFCPNGDCTGSPLAFWMLDDCNPPSTQLARLRVHLGDHPPGVPRGQRRLRGQRRQPGDPPGRDRRHRLRARSARLPVRSRADRGGLDQPRQRQRDAEHLPQAPRRVELVPAGDRRRQADLRAQADQRQERGDFRRHQGEALHPRGRHLRRQAGAALRQRRGRCQRQGQRERSRRARARSWSATTPTDAR